MNLIFDILIQIKTIKSELFMFLNENIINKNLTFAWKQISTSF